MLQANTIQRMELSTCLRPTRTMHYNQIKSFFWGTWRLQFLRSGTILSNVFSTMKSNSRKTGVRRFYLLEATTSDIKYLSSFLRSTFLLFTWNKIVTVNPLFMFCPSHRFKELDLSCKYFCLFFLHYVLIHKYSIFYVHAWLSRTILFTFLPVPLTFFWAMYNYIVKVLNKTKS